MKTLEAELDKLLLDYGNKIYSMMRPAIKAEFHNTIHSRFLKETIGAHTFDDFVYSKNFGKIICPNSACIDNNIVKFGKDSNGKQRYRCKNCGKTFSATSNSLSSGSLQDLGHWIPFVHGMLRQLTTKELSEECDISVSTVSNWKIKFFEAISHLQSQVKLSGVIVADETKVNYNLKGNHGGDFIMPRSSRSRGGQNTIKNYKANQLSILCAVDDSGRSFSAITGFGDASASRLKKCFEGRLDVTESTVLVTDGAASYGAIAKSLGIPKWERLVTLKKGKKRVPDTRGKHNIQSINAYHMKLKSFLHPYKGVGTKYLSHYLMLFDFLQNNKNIARDYLCRQILETIAMLDYVPREKILFQSYQIPVSNGKETETWERYVPVTDQKIYLYHIDGHSATETATSFKVKVSRVYYIKKKVEKLGLHQKILEKRKKPASKVRSLQPIPPKQWEIYCMYQTDNKTMADIGKIYGMTGSNVSLIVNKIKARPEGTLVRKSTRSKAGTRFCKNEDQINQQIYKDFLFLDIVGAKLCNIYKLLSDKYSLTYRGIEGRLSRARQKDCCTRTNFRWNAERKSLSRNDFEIFSKKRNKKIYIDFSKMCQSDTKASCFSIYSALAKEHRLSVSHIKRIIHDIKLLNHDSTTYHTHTAF